MFIFPFILSACLFDFIFKKKSKGEIMNIAFLILCHKNPDQINVLIRKLSPYNIFIHIDKKSDIQPFLRDLNLENVHFLKNRITTSWGGLFTM